MTPTGRLPSQATSVLPAREPLQRSLSRVAAADLERRDAQPEPVLVLEVVDEALLDHGLADALRVIRRAPVVVLHEHAALLAGARTDDGRDDLARDGRNDVRVDGRHDGADGQLGSGPEAGALGDDRRHLDEIQVVDTCVAKGVVEGRERRQAFGAPLREVKEAGYV